MCGGGVRGEGPRAVWPRGCNAGEVFMGVGFWRGA